MIKIETRYHLFLLQKPISNKLESVLQRNRNERRKRRSLGDTEIAILNTERRTQQKHQRWMRLQVIITKTTRIRKPTIIQEKKIMVTVSVIMVRIVQVRSWKQNRFSFHKETDTTNV